MMFGRTLEEAEILDGLSLEEVKIKFGIKDGVNVSLNSSTSVTDCDVSASCYCFMCDCGLDNDTYEKLRNSGLRGFNSILVLDNYFMHDIAKQFNLRVCSYYPEDIINKYLEFRGDAIKNFITYVKMNDFHLTNNFTLDDYDSL